MSDFNKALQLKPEYPEALLRRGEMRFNLSQVNEALTDINEAIRLKPTYAEAYYYLSQVMYKTGKKPEAQAAINKAVQYDPNNVTYSNYKKAIASN